MEFGVHRLAVFLFTLGCNLILFGLLAELVARTRHEAQSETIYLVRERQNFEESLPPA